MALDLRPADTFRWIDAAAPTHPSLIDTSHVTGEAFGFINIPMAVWIDEDGMIVRNAESASIERSPLRDAEIPPDTPEPMASLLREVKAIPDHSESYRAAIVDWAHTGAASPYALTPDEVIARSQPRSADRARATACFTLGSHLATTGESADAITWWKKAHALDPTNWTYKRQAWTLSTTPEGAEGNDLFQNADATYGTSWLNEVIALGGGAAYVVEPQLAPGTAD